MILKAFEINSKKEFDIKVSVIEDENEELITISTEFNNIKIEHSDEFHFTTFQKFRIKLIENNIDLKCKGALINAYPSPMMMTSEKVYILELGKQSKMDSVANIYDFIDILESNHPDKQDLFYKNWTKSLRHKN
ncbi:hypothetical protein LNJ03_12115 [Tenacibaculum dicentrarchi]|nr:hypothetical protein [Tenacibaculum dicentrarchi]